MRDQTNKNSTSHTLTVRLASEVDDGLEALARDTDRSKSYLAGAAIADFVKRNAWQVARIKAALEEARSGLPGIPHENVANWVRSWGTDHELPRPRPEIEP